MAAAAFEHQVAAVASPPVLTPAAPDHTAVYLIEQEPPAWCDPLLALLVRPRKLPLDSKDLADCGTMSHQWPRVAADPALQASCFVQTYPSFYSQKLEQVQGQGRALQLLALWCESLKPDSVEKTERQELISQDLPWQRAFYTLVRQQIQTRFFSTRQSDMFDCGSRRTLELAWSPDGRHLAHSAHNLSDDSSCICIYRHDLLHMQRLGNFASHQSVSGLSFDVQGRSLEAVNNAGWLQKWEPDTPEHWHKVEETARNLTDKDFVPGASASPDGRYRALPMSNARVALFCNVTADAWPPQDANWQQHYLWKGNRAGLDAVLNHLPAAFRDSVLQRMALPVPERAVFSKDSQSLLITAGGEISILRHIGSDWREYNLEARSSLMNGAVLSPDGRLLAVSSRRQEPSPDDETQQHKGASGGPDRPDNTLGSIGVRMELWRYVPDPGWHRTAATPRQQEYRYMLAPGWHPVISKQCSYACPPPVAGAFRTVGIPTFTAVFSPDGQLLAFPDKGARSSCLRVLSTAASEVGKEPVVLPLEAGAGNSDGRPRLLRSAQFSANGHHLVATDNIGAHIWQNDPARGWVIAARIDNPVGGPIQAAFSPDGYHCALAMGERSSISVWGAYYSAGPVHWVQKLSLDWDGSVEKVLFTPDGSRLLITYSRHEQPGAGQSSLKLACLPLVPEAHLPEDIRL